MIHLALVNDHPAVLAGLRRLIDPEADLLVVALAARAAQADAVVDKAEPVSALLAAADRR